MGTDRERAQPLLPIGTMVLAKWSSASFRWKRATVVATDHAGAVVRFDGYSDTATIPHERIKRLQAGADYLAPKAEAKAGPKAEAKAGPKAEAKAGPKAEAKAAMNGEHNAEGKGETRGGMKAELKAEQASRAHPKQQATTPAGAAEHRKPVPEAPASKAPRSQESKAPRRAQRASEGGGTACSQSHAQSSPGGLPTGGPHGVRRQSSGSLRCRGGSQ